MAAGSRGKAAKSQAAPRPSGPAFGRMPRNPAPPPATPLPRLALYLSAEAESHSARATSTGPGAKAAPVRQCIPVPSGSTPELRWAIKNLDARQPAKDIVVHFLIHSLQLRGEALPPVPVKGSLADQVMGTDLAAGRQTTGRYRLPIHRPGVYLVQIEIVDIQGSRRQQASLELEVA